MRLISCSLVTTSFGTGKEHGLGKQQPIKAPVEHFEKVGGSADETMK
jgi:hypothetical protein